MKKKSYGLGRFIYTEWLQPIFHYYMTLRKNEAVFEVVTPIVISVVSVSMYSYRGIIYKALSVLAELLPTSISVLIGFTVMMITLLLTSSGENIERIKGIKTERLINNKPVTLYQGLHIQFSHTLFSEVILLLIVFLYLFLDGLNLIKRIEFLFLGVEVYLILNILLSVMRGMANIYFSFYGDSLKR